MGTNKDEKPIITGAMIVALGAVFIVWCGGAIFNFSEQSRYAEVSGFELPFLLPLLLDGLAIALASVAMTASMDGRAAIVPRLGTIIAVGASSWVSGQAAASRAHLRVDSMSLATRFEPNRVIIGVAVPLLSLLAFEVLLVEIRRIVQRIRGRKSPVPIPMPRLVMWMIQPPWRTFATWRTSALEQCTRELEITQGRAVEATITQVKTCDKAPVLSPTDTPKSLPSVPVRTSPRPASPVSGDRVAALAALLREHGTELGVTRFRELARTAKIPCPNGEARELLSRARATLEGGLSE